MTAALDSTLKLLRSYSCLVPKSVTPEEKIPLQRAIVEITQYTESQNFGVCADTADQALQSLIQYLKGVGYDVAEVSLPEHSIVGATYLKYNVQQQSFYLDEYRGDYRGVLIACQGDDQLSGTYGYFPLDLFDGITIDALDDLL